MSSFLFHVTKRRQAPLAVAFVCSLFVLSSGFVYANHHHKPATKPAKAQVHYHYHYYGKKPNGTLPTPSLPASHKGKWNVHIHYHFHAPKHRHHKGHKGHHGHKHHGHGHYGHHKGHHGHKHHKGHHGHKHHGHKHHGHHKGHHGHKHHKGHHGSHKGHHGHKHHGHGHKHHGHGHKHHGHKGHHGHHKHHGHKHHSHKHQGHRHNGRVIKHKGHHGHKHHGMQHDFSDIKRWVRIFEDPKRKLYQQPAKVAKYMDIKSGMTVADIGAGTGYFLPHIQSYLKQSGQILGLDISKSMVDYMNKRFKKAGWKNAVAKVVAPDDPKMAKGSVDRILIANTWHHIGNRVAYAKKLKAGLKKGGALYILDFTMDSPFGPGKHHRLTPKQVQTELAKAGFKATILKETIPYHYIVVGR